MVIDIRNKDNMIQFATEHGLNVKEIPNGVSITDPSTVFNIAYYTYKNGSEGLMASIGDNTVNFNISNLENSSEAEFNSFNNKIDSVIMLKEQISSLNETINDLSKEIADEEKAINIAEEREDDEEQVYHEEQYIGLKNERASMIKQKAGLKEQLQKMIYPGNDKSYNQKQDRQEQKSRSSQYEKFKQHLEYLKTQNKKSYKQMPKWKVAKYAYENKDNADADIRNEAKKYLDSVNQKTMDILKKKLEEKDNRSSSANNQRKPRVLGNIADQLNQIRLQEEQQHKQEKAVLHDEVVSQSDQIQQMEQYVSENIPENDPGQTRPQVQPQPNYLEEAVQELQQAGISITPDKMNEICIKGMQKESKDLKRQIDNLQKQLDKSIFVAVSNGCPPEIVNEVKKLNDTLATETKRYVTYRETLLQAGIDIEKEQQEKQQEKNTQLPPEVQAGKYLKDNIKDGLETMEKNRKEIDRAASASNKSEFFQQLPNKILRNSMRHEREACICNAEAARKLYKKAASIRNKALKRQSAKGFGGKLRRSFARLANTTMFHDGKPIHEGMSYYELTRYNKLMTAAQTLKDMSQENYKKWEKMKDKFDRYKDSRDTYHEKNGIKSSKAFDKMVEKVTVESNRMANEKKDEYEKMSKAENQARGNDEKNKNR